MGFFSKLWNFLFPHNNNNNNSNQKIYSDSINELNSHIEQYKETNKKLENFNLKDNIVDSVVFRSNSAVEGSAIYLCDNEALTLKKVTLEGNVNSGSSSGSGFCTIHVGDYAKINIPGDDLTRVGDQHIHLNNKYLTDILYVNSVVLGDGSGLTTSDAGLLTDDLLSNLNDGGKVVFLNDGSVYSLSPVNISNLNNIVFVGNSTTVQISENKKYLFNPLKKIKNLSLNNYLSSQSLRIKKIKNVQNKYFH